MSAWGSNNTSAGAPRVKMPDAKADSVRGNTMFANTTVGAFINNVSTGIYGIPTAGSNTIIGQPGWVRQTKFTGPVINFIINVAGNNYTNSDSIKVSNGTINATANIIAVNGAITGFGNLVGGQFVNNSVAVVTYTVTANGSGANVVPVLGGRANRTQYEVLTVLGEITGNTYIPS